MVTTFNPTRLSLARRRRGLTMVELGELTGVAWRTVAAFESEKSAHAREPSHETVASFSKVLEFPSAFFYGPTLDEPPVEGASFRALSTLTRRQKASALAAGTLALSLSDWINESFQLPEPAIPQYQGVDPEGAAVAVRNEWGLGERPIRNMIHLLEVNGVRVFSLAEDTVDIDAFSFWRGDIPYIFLNTKKSAERSRMDAAHELGHLVLHWKGTVQGRAAEQEANHFGSAFLMPQGSLVAEAPRGATLSKLIEAKQRWNVSVASLAYRMHKLGLLSEWQYRTIFMQIGRNHYRTNEPNTSQPETSQVLGKVFNSLRGDGVPIGEVANRLSISLNELSKLVFGLVLTPLAGSSDASLGGSSAGNPNLRLVE